MQAMQGMPNETPQSQSSSNPPSSDLGGEWQVPISRAPPTAQFQGGNNHGGMRGGYQGQAQAQQQGYQGYGQQQQWN